MSQYLPDFAPGPLDRYRTKASFDWRKMKIFLDTEEVVKYEYELQQALKNHPDFQNLQTPTFDEERRIAARRASAIRDITQTSIYTVLKNIKRVPVLLRNLMQLTPSSTVKALASFELFNNVLRSEGTERHWRFLEQSENGEISGCFCMTEVAHGTNARGIRTTATYDKDKRQFVMHTPDFEAAKCWPGGLGQLASHAIVYAQLYVDGAHHGLHNFVVPIRDPKTLVPYPGVIAGDLGETIGLNGVDNGFLIFDQYRIPRENILNKIADVTPDGKYVTPFKSGNDRYGAAIGVLSIGRVNITAICEHFGTKALTIAVRYAAVRKQFGPDPGEEEVPILEYQSHQFRLLPYLAGVYVVRLFSTFLIEKTYQFNIDSLLGQNEDLLPELGMEIHVVSSGSKPVSGWLFRAAIQECREACGGHGYLKASGFGDLRNDHDANLTYEGDNHVLIQQTSNWLLKLWPAVEAGRKIATPLRSADFLSNAVGILRQGRFSVGDLDQTCRPETIMNAYRWLVCYLLKETKHKVDALMRQDGDRFWAKNNSQVFYAKRLAIAFTEHFFLQHVSERIEEAGDGDVKSVLSKLLSLYGLWSLEKFLGVLYEGGYAQGSEPSRLIHEGILHLCSLVKDDAVSLIDAVAPPDFVLNSVLGASDGRVYKHLRDAIFRSPYAMTRPSWYLEIVNWNSNKNKL